VVIVGILAGPSVVNCFNSPDGLGQCLQGKMREAGILPGTTPAPVEATATAVDPVEPAVDAAAATDTALIEPELDVVPVDAAAAAVNAAAEAPDSLIAATFGLLRAEPDGSVVIAGSGTPGSEIEVYSNGTLLGKTTVESSGDWVLVPDVRIAPGGTEITLGEAGKDGLAPQSFVVAINEDKTSEPLVVASTPGEVSEVLQGLPRATAASKTQLATATPQADTAAAKPDADAVQPAVAANESATTAAGEQTAALASAMTAAVEEPVVAATAAAAAVASAAQTAAATPEAEPVVPADEVVDTAVATATATSDLTKPAADEPATTSDPSAASTEAVLPATAAEVSKPAMEVAAADPAATAPATAAPAPVADLAVATIDAVEVEGDRAFFAGSGANGATVRLYVDDAFIAETTVSGGRWLIEAGKVLSKPNQRVRIDMLQTGSADVASRAEVDFVIDMPADVEPVVAAEATAASQADAEPAPSAVEMASAADTAIPTMVAVTIGSADDQRFAAGKAIIRRGDNLWTIARRVYGEGIKYTTIYEANTGQIRDPDRIYPGQVFNLPEGAIN